MFDFISKLFPKRASSANIISPTVEQITQRQVQEEKKKEVEQNRAAYLRKIEDAKGDETVIVDLLLHCDFADGRFQAAQFVTTKGHLAQVRDAMKNLDKRVAKLMQARLDIISKSDALIAAAEKCSAQIDAYLKQDFVSSNQVVELDKSLEKLHDLPSELQERLKQKRQILDLQIEEQTRLQRVLLDLIPKIDAVNDYGNPALELEIKVWQESIEQAQAHQLAASLPKNLVAECKAKLSALQNSWARAQQSVNSSAHPVVIEGEENTVVSEAIHTIEKTPAPVPMRQQKTALSMSLAQVETSLQGLLAALEQGSVQTARKFERELKDVDVKQRYSDISLPESVKETLTAARKELAHLQSWAKWSGDASREELVNTAEGLAALKLGPKEIVGTVTALRDQWKQMELTSGGGNKELWARFDAACTKAYAPAAEYFSEQAEQRKANLNEVQAQLDALRVEAKNLLDVAPDWKAMRVTLIKIQQLGKKLASLDRKARTMIEAEIAQLHSSLNTPLEERQKEEIASRELLIADVKALDSSQKSTVDRLRAIQQKWQIQAATIPLSRKDEQALWERFRAACDGVFEQRREAAETADKQRQENLVAKLALCSELEQFASNSIKDIEACIEKYRAQWDTIGYVPRQQELQVFQRFETAQSRLRDQIDLLRKQQHEQSKLTFLKKLEISQNIDALFVDAQVNVEQLNALRAQSEEIRVASNKLNTVLNARVQAACSAAANDVVTYQSSLAGNVVVFDGLLLELEILMSQESPAAFAQERLQKQVKLLQTSLKNGNQQQELRDKLMAILAMPVLMTAERQSRLKTLMQRFELKDLA